MTEDREKKEIVAGTGIAANACGPLTVDARARVPPSMVDAHRLSRWTPVRSPHDPQQLGAIPSGSKQESDA